MIIRDILNMKGGAIFSAPPDSRLAEAVGMMVKNDIGSLVVMEGGRMTGMLTFREVLKALDAQGGNLADLRLREVMTKNHVRYLPVTEEDWLLGVISFHDIAKAVIKETSFENRLLKRYIKSRPETDEQ